MVSTRRSTTFGKALLVFRNLKSSVNRFISKWKNAAPKTCAPKKSAPKKQQKHSSVRVLKVISRTRSARFAASRRFRAFKKAKATRSGQEPNTNTSVATPASIVVNDPRNEPTKASTTSQTVGLNFNPGEFFAYDLYVRPMSLRYKQVSVLDDLLKGCSKTSPLYGKCGEQLEMAKTNIMSIFQMMKTQDTEMKERMDEADQALTNIVKLLKDNGLELPQDQEQILLHKPLTIRYKQVGVLDFILAKYPKNGSIYLTYGEQLEKAKNFVLAVSETMKAHENQMKERVAEADRTLETLVALLKDSGITIALEQEQILLQKFGSIRCRIAAKRTSSSKDLDSVERIKRMFQVGAHGDPEVAAPLFTSGTLKLMQLVQQKQARVLISPVDCN